jgi:hypothetical protein
MIAAGKIVELIAKISVAIIEEGVKEQLAEGDAYNYEHSLGEVRPRIAPRNADQSFLLSISNLRYPRESAAHVLYSNRATSDSPRITVSPEFSVVSVTLGVLGSLRKVPLRES